MTEVDKVISGNVRTRDLTHNRPYYVIKYTEQNMADVDAKEFDNCRWIAHNVSREFLDSEFFLLIKSIKELEGLHCEWEALSVDFTIDDGEVRIVHAEQLDEISEVPRVMSDKEFIDTKSIAKCIYLDTHHMLSEGAYLNLLRLLGNNPKPLEFSLLKEFIDTGGWNDVITCMGYEGNENELFIRIGNKPYTSLNNMFLGLMPVGLKVMTKYKLENYYEQYVRDNKSRGETFEKSVLFDSYASDTAERLAALKEYGFTDVDITEITEALKNQTVSVVQNYSFMNRKYNQGLEKMKRLREKIYASEPFSESNSMKLNRYVEKLVVAIRNYVAPALMYQERCVNISRGYYEMPDSNDKDTREMLYKLSREMWTNVKRAERYDGIFNIRMNARANQDVWDEPLEAKETSDKVSVSEIKKALEQAKIDLEPGLFAEFLVSSVESEKKIMREFIEDVRLVMGIVIRLGGLLGIEYEDMSYLEVRDLLSYHSRDSYIHIIQSRRHMYHANTYVVLPKLICDVGDIDIIDER
ncbi:MAG: hypothetical protein NC225_01855 [Clostridium sp.]|nr:hypothetical protein [Clostridium sp.]MCM1398206.1 hypothetical protein [Clostridium sp.]MCM1460380.1 hypothetical protein [Bacteroides sp.]